MRDYVWKIMLQPHQLYEKEGCYVQGKNTVGPKSFCSAVGFFLSVHFQFIGPCVDGGTQVGQTADPEQTRQVAGRRDIDFKAFCRRAAKAPWLQEGILRRYGRPRTFNPIRCGGNIFACDFELQ